MRTLVGLYGDCHLSPRRKSAEVGIRYCTKKETRIGTPFSWGKLASVQRIEERERNGGGMEEQITDFRSCTDMIRNGEATPHSIASTHPHVYARHYKGLMQLHSELIPDVHGKRTVWVFYGEADTGKTRDAYRIAQQHYKDDEIYKYERMGQGETEWWERYQTQPCIIIDEMRGSKFCFDRFLTVLDRYPTMVPWKGGSSKFSAELIIITSNIKPSEWYGPQEHWPALRRRIDECRRYMLMVDDAGAILPDEQGLAQYAAVLDRKEMKHDDVTGRNADALKRHRENNGCIRPSTTVEIDTTLDELDIQASCDSMADNDFDSFSDEFDGGAFEEYCARSEQ